MNRCRRRLLGALTLGFLVAAPELPAQAAEPLVLGVYPFAAAEVVEARFNPLAGYLAANIGRPVVVHVGRDYAEHLASIELGRIDIAFVGPGNVGRIPRGNLPLFLLGKLRIGEHAFMDSVLAVRHDSPLMQVSHLKGRRIAFKDPYSTTGYQLPLALLREAGINETALGNFRFVGSETNVALAILAGDADAGALRAATFRRFTARGLRVLTTMPRIPEHAFVAGGRVDAALAHRLTELLQAMSGNANGRTVLAGLQDGASGIVAADWAEYASVRRILDGQPVP